MTTSTWKGKIDGKILDGLSASVISFYCLRSVRVALGAAFFNKGENCIAAGRIFVEETIYDEFLKRAAVEVRPLARIWAGDQKSCVHR